MSKNKFKVGDKVICLFYGKNNSEMIKGLEYIVSETDGNGMVKLKGHPDWWHQKRFKKSSNEADKQIKQNPFGG